jgi:hypothetical protein
VCSVKQHELAHFSLCAFFKTVKISPVKTKE